jgi:hypothetical protein
VVLQTTKIHKYIRKSIYFIIYLIFFKFLYIRYINKMSLVANTVNDTPILTKSIKIYPQSRVNMKPSGNGVSQLNFLLPASLELLDPRNLAIQYYLQFIGRGMPKCNPVAGVHSLWRTMRTQVQGGSGAVLEEVDEYSSMVAQRYSYEDDGAAIRHQRELEEGVSLTNDNQNQLFWGAMPTPTVGITAGQSAKKVQISQPLYSGLLGRNSRVVPLLREALDGLRLQMETNTLMKAVKLNGGDKLDPEVALVSLTVAPAAWNNASLDHIVNVEVNTGITDGNKNKFEVGDAMYYDVGGTDTLVGLVVNVGVANGNCAIRVSGHISANTDGPQLLAGIKVYTRPVDRFNGWNANAADFGSSAPILLAKEQALVKVDYTISDIEMLVERVIAPAPYISAMIAKINSSDGMRMLFKNNTLHRVNIVGTNGMLTSDINNQAKRAYAVNVSPLNTVDTFDGNNLTCVGVDGAQTYIFSINGVLTPDQRVPLRRMTLTPPFVEQIHLQETRKSLLNSGVIVRNLQNAEDNFVIGRAFSKYGAVSNVTEQQMSLRVEYTGAVRQKTMNCYVCSTREMIIRNNGVDVVY